MKSNINNIEQVTIDIDNDKDHLNDDDNNVEEIKKSRATFHNYSSYYCNNKIKRTANKKQMILK